MRLLKPAITVALLSSLAANAQVTTRYSDTQRQGEAITTDEQTPDTTGLWYHIEQGQQKLANQTFARLKQEYPGWQPPQVLNDALKQLNHPQPRQDLPATPSPAAAKPVPGPTPAEALFARLSSVAASEWQTISRAQLAEAIKLAEASGQADYHVLLGWILHQRHNYASAISQFSAALTKSDDRKVAKAVNDGINSSVDGLVSTALVTPDTETLAQLQARYPEHAIREQVAGQAWRFFDEKDYVRALELFTFDEQVEGQVLALAQLDRASDAAQLACAHAEESAPLRQHCANYWAQQQVADYEQKNYRASIQAALTLRNARKLTSGEAELLGWAFLSAGQKNNAKAQFATLLSAQPDNHDFAQALLSLARNGKERRDMAAQYPTVATLLTQQNAQQAWQRKQFNLAWLDGAEQAKTTYPDNRLSVYSGLNARQRSGESGQGNFDVLRGYVGMVDSIGPWRWNVHVDYEQLYSGAVEAQQWFGDGQAQTPFGGITGFEDTGLRGRLQGQWQDYTLYAELGYSLLDQPQSSLLTGQLGATWFFDSDTISAMVYRQRVEDSLLSMGSTYFAYSDKSWGAVTRLGVRGLYVHTLSPARALSVSWVTDQYTGEQVVANNHLGVRLDASEDIRASIDWPLDYLRVGPYLSWQGFSDNLSGFTRGHGGYFSPQSLLSTGVNASLLTAEGAQWQARASVSVGYSWIEQESYQRFPLSGAGPQVAGQSDTGIDANLTLEGQYLFGQHWQIAGFIRQAFAVEYRSTWAGIELRWHAGKYQGVTSDTLILSNPELSGLAL